jgi:uncharacterized membrane protein
LADSSRSLTDIKFRYFDSGKVEAVDGLGLHVSIFENFKPRITIKRKLVRTPASIAGHPIHPMLVAFPIGLLVFSLICDLISLRGVNPETWVTVALYTMVGGFIGALAAAIPGAIDLLSLTDSRIKKIALFHMSLNLIAVTLYAVNIWLRLSGADIRGTPLVLSAVAVGILAVSGWLGAEMVHKHGVGVDTGPESSMHRRP